MILRICKDCNMEYEDFPEGRKGRCRICHNKYRRHLYHNPKPRSYIRVSLMERYLSGVDKRTDDACWPWKMSIGSHGYAQINEGGRGQPILGHRLAWEIYRGPIPDGLTIDHVICQHRWCQNPNHMELVTLEENGRRAAILYWKNRKG